MKRIGLSRLKSLEPVELVRRYEREAAGELLHIDTKRLGRINGVGHRITGDRTKNRNKGIGWDAVHLAIDDHSRVSFARIKPDCWTHTGPWRHRRANGIRPPWWTRSRFCGVLVVTRKMPPNFYTPMSVLTGPTPHMDG